MKTASYRLPAGVHPLLEPVVTGQTPDTKDAKGNVVKGRPIYTAVTIDTPEAESLEEFVEKLVQADDAKGHTLTLAQGQLDIIRQRKIREYAASQEVADLFDRKSDETKDITDDEALKEYIIAKIQEVGDAYLYGARAQATGGANAAAKAALKREQALATAASADPELAALQAKLNAKLAEIMGAAGA